MQKRKTITLSAIIYTMLRRWGIMLVTFILVFGVGMGLTVMDNKERQKEKASEEAKAKVAAEATNNLQEKNLDDILSYEKYIRDSAYMNLDPTNCHIHYVHYYINWKEQGLDPAVYENKNITLYQYMSLYYTSDTFLKEIYSVKPEYEDKALHEVIGMSRSGNTYIYYVIYTDNSYVKDVCDVIDASLKKKSPEWYSLEGEFEFKHGPETDVTVDGVTSGYKGVQDGKLAALANMQAAANAATPAKTTVKDGSMAEKVLSVAAIALICALVVGFIAALYRRRFDTSTDISDLTGDDVICILKGEKESGLDKSFYKKDERYKDPETYLSVSEKSMTDMGIRKVYLYNCSDKDMASACARVSENMNKLEVVPVSEDNKDFYLEAKADEAVLIMVKGGKTDKRSYLRIKEHLDKLGVKCPGVIFAL